MQISFFAIDKKCKKPLFYYWKKCPALETGVAVGDTDELNELKWSEINWNEMKWIEMKWIEMNWIVSNQIELKCNAMK